MGCGWVLHGRHEWLTSSWLTPRASAAVRSTCGSSAGSLRPGRALLGLVTRGQDNAPVKRTSKPFVGVALTGLVLPPERQKAGMVTSIEVKYRTSVGWMQECGMPQQW